MSGIDGLSDADLEAELERRRNKPARKVRVTGEHEGTRYEFELDGDEAERVISRHAGLFAPEPAPADDGKDKKPGRPHLIPPGRKAAGG